jgi:hypothetical protein
MSKPRINDNGPFLHLGIRIRWFVTSSPSGFDRIYLVGVA